MALVRAWAVAVVVVAGLAGCERSPHRRVKPLSAIVEWMQPLPRRGVATSRGGLGSYGPVFQRVVVDFDTGTLTATDETGPTATKPLPAAELARVIDLTESAWAAPDPRFHDVSDYGETIVAVDGKDAMVVSTSGPLQPSPASTLVTALRADAGWQP